MTYPPDLEDKLRAEFLRRVRERRPVEPKRLEPKPADAERHYEEASR